jgi:hypothetical protein
MGYHIYLFRKEVKENNRDLEFLENYELITPFTDDQFNTLKSRLLRYGYQVENEQHDSLTLNYKGGQSGISVVLTRRQLSFSSGFDQAGVFEISQTASEFTDTGEFKKLDPQDGQWEEF